MERGGYKTSFIDVKSKEVLMQEAAQPFNVPKSLLQEEIKRQGKGIKQNWSQVWNIWRFFFLNGGAVGQSWQRSRQLVLHCKILRFVDRASYNDSLLITNVMHKFLSVFIFIYNSLHVSSTPCSSSGETNCNNTTSGNCLCWWPCCVQVGGRQLFVKDGVPEVGTCFGRRYAYCS